MRDTDPLAPINNHSSSLVGSARDNDGHRWLAKHEDLYSAAVALAGLVGFELEDG